MKFLSIARVKPLAVRTAVAAAAIAACSAASAATFDPGVLGVASPAFSFDTITVNDFAKITLVGSTFSETGLLNIPSFSNAGVAVTPSGYGVNYGLYVSFTASGAGGVLTGLNYNVYGYTGPAATFAVTEAGATKSGSMGTLLGGGMLIPGVTNTYGGDGVNVAYLVANTLSFGSMSGAFTGVSGASASFINAGNQIAPTSTGFLVGAGSVPGGGTIQLVSAVPEPETYALMLGGLAAIGFVARRRTNG